jgi:hypothetical protein
MVRLSSQAESRCAAAFRPVIEVLGTDLLAVSLSGFNPEGKIMPDRRDTCFRV